MLYEDITLEDVREIVRLMEEDCQGEVNSWVDKGRLFVQGENGSDLMIRFNKYNKTIVIARIQFVQQRKGYGTKLLELLSRFAEKNGYEYLLVESVLSESMKQFVLKHGFEKVPHAMFDYRKKVQPIQ
jgi:GNAT superfamily N-acetyltransferase